MVAPRIAEPASDPEIMRTYEVMRQLRPEMSPDEYVPAVRRLMAQEDYRLVTVLDDEQVRAVAGYRLMEMLYCGRILYIDDLVTDERVRSRGFGRQLLDWLKEAARARRCTEVHLDSRLHREAAHRFYEREGFTKTCYHLVAVV